LLVLVGRHIRDAEDPSKVEDVPETTVATTQADAFHHKFGSTRVQIHNIRSSLPRPEIEMIYTVYQGKDLIISNLTLKKLIKGCFINNR
jgi:hypothetical protein